jgi:hypothetical protein
MKAAIVQRRDLDVLDLAAAVRPLQFEAEIGELDVPVTHGQLVLESPVPDLAIGSTDATVGIRPSAVGLLQEALIFTLQVVLEHDSQQPRIAVRVARQGTLERAIDLGVVLELARPQDVRMERLRVLMARVAVCLQQLSSLVREGDDRRALVAVERRHGTNQAVRPQAFDGPVPDVSRAATVVPNVVHGHDAEGTDRRECLDLRATEFERLVAERYRLTRPAARKVQPVGERVSGIPARTTPGVR